MKLTKPKHHRGDADIGIIIVILIAVFIWLALMSILQNTENTTPETRAQALESKYFMGKGLTVYHFDSFIYTNNTLTFFDIARQQEFTFIGQKFDIQTRPKD